MARAGDERRREEVSSREERQRERWGQKERQTVSRDVVHGVSGRDVLGCLSDDDPELDCIEGVGTKSAKRRKGRSSSPSPLLLCSPSHSSRLPLGLTFVVDDDSLGDLDDASVLDVRGCGLQEKEGFRGDLVAELFGVSAIVPAAARGGKVRAQVEPKGRGEIGDSFRSRQSSFLPCRS